jgi:hypothetical protein
MKIMTKSPSPKPKKPKLTDAERHERFVALAKHVGASENPKDFDRALDAVIKPSDRHSRRNDPQASS